MGVPKRTPRKHSGPGCGWKAWRTSYVVVTVAASQFEVTQSRIRALAMILCGKSPAFVSAVAFQGWRQRHSGLSPSESDKQCWLATARKIDLAAGNFPFQCCRKCQELTAQGSQVVGRPRHSSRVYVKSKALARAGPLELKQP